jgi:hypothetical protein
VTTYKGIKETDVRPGDPSQVTHVATTAASV